MPFIAPVIAALATTFGAVATFVASSAVLTSLVTAGIGIAATYLLSSLLPKPQQAADDTVPSGVKFERQYGNNISRQVPCGLIGMAGHDCYVNTYGESNKYLQQVYTISDYYTTELTRVGINGAWQNLGAPDGQGRRPITSGDFAGYITVTFVDGRQSTANAVLVANSNPSSRWPSANVGYGVSYIMVEMTYDQEKNSSFPDFFFEFRGAPLYDPRKDTSVGGSGPHRWNDPTTHEFSENPIVIEYNYRRGIKYGDDVFCGMDMLPAELPLDKYFTAMNICDELVDGSPRYRVSIILDCMAKHSDNLASLSVSCGSMQVDAIYGSYPIVGSDQPSVIEFTDDDILLIADYEYQAKRSMGELINSVGGNFPYPDLLWSMIGYTPQTADDYVILDRRTRDVNIDYPMVRDAGQAARLAWIALYENRYEAKATVALRPRFRGLEAGDWVTWRSDQYAASWGSPTKIFMVAGTQLMSLDSDKPRAVVLTLQERDGRIYEGIAPPPIIVPTPPGEPVYLQEVESFDAVAVAVVGDNGRAQAALRASWLPITDPTVTGVELRWYPQDQIASVVTKQVTRDVNITNCVEGIVGNTDYVIQARLITNPARTTTFNVGKVIKTLDIVVDLGAGITYQVTTALNKLNDKIAEWDQLNSSVTSNQNARNWLDKQMNQRQMMVVNQKLSASINEVMQVAVDTQTAFADYQLVVNAQLADQNATITQQATAIAGIDGKLLATATLTLDVNGRVSGYKAYNDGTTSVFAIRADAFYVGFPGYSNKQAFAIVNVNGVAQAALSGNFYGDGTVSALAINTPSLTAISANFGNAVVTGRITTTGDKLVTDYGNARIEVNP